MALGGSLYQQVQDVPGKLDHREDKSRSYDGQYQPSHAITLVEDEVVRGWAGGAEVMVNSLHGQGADRLADGLEPLAFAPDGTIEMVRIRAARTFAYGTQFHPEYQSWENPFMTPFLRPLARRVGIEIAQEAHKKRKKQTIFG